MSDGGEDVVDLLGDDYVRTILAETREEPKSVEALSDACDADPSTIYRRVERLEAAGLLTDEQRLDPGGHHYKEYDAVLEAVHVHVRAEGYEIDVDYVEEEEPADRFTRLYEEFK
ncbi:MULTISPECIES: helix-turn-helix domain-containing protein [Halolamina]|uniref:Helix-turn-helix domain-containing protein n=1 Tax=Halolamina salina TaxID=1220023 RepID=A0ABD6B549_9EURY